jgi:hypothetical protein
MLFLVFYVFNDDILFSGGMRERTVTFLPGRKFWKIASGFHPKAAGDLDVFDVIGQGQRRMQIGENVQVVIRAVDAVEVAALLFNNAENVIVKFTAIVFWKGVFPVFGTKNDMVEDLPVGAHGGFGLKVNWMSDKCFGARS